MELLRQAEGLDPENRGRTQAGEEPRRKLGTRPVRQGRQNPQQTGSIRSDRRVAGADWSEEAWAPLPESRCAMIAAVDQPVDRHNPVTGLLKTTSASRLNCWLQCRLKFYFRYVLQITKPKTAALHFGSVVHLVLQQWNMARWRKQQFEITRLKQVFETGWIDQGSVINWDGEEPNQKNTAWSVLEKYFTDTPIKANEMPEAVEVPVEADLSKHGLPVLLGVLDLVRAGGRIVDFKSTGRSEERR